MYNAAVVRLHYQNNCWNEQSFKCCYATLYKCPSLCISFNWCTVPFEWHKLLNLLLSLPVSCIKVHMMWHKSWEFEYNIFLLISNINFTITATTPYPDSKSPANIELKHKMTLSGVSYFCRDCAVEITFQLY